MEEYSNDEAPQIQSVKNTQRYMPPSSAGFSFFIKGNAIKLRVFYNAVNFLSGEEKDEKNQKFVAQSGEVANYPATEKSLLNETFA